MAKNIGTLIGAPVRVNDSLDIYPSAVDNELKGGRMSMLTIADRDAIPADRRSAGMQCYVFADKNTYQLDNDLVTWLLLTASSSGGSSNPGSGGTNPDVTLISGNFGEWTDVDNKSTDFVNENFPLQFKSDLQAFPTRAIVYVQGQFGLNSGFSGTTWVLGQLPPNSRPQFQLKKWMVCQTIEMWLVIEANGTTDGSGNDIGGQISLESKDGFNLPVTAGTPETDPYYVDCFFNPLVTLVPPTIYTSTRTETFTRNNCGTGMVGSLVSYSQDYTSTVDQATADALAAADPNFEAAGQAYANANGTCSVDPSNNAFVVNNRTAGVQEVIFTGLGGGGGPYTLGGTLPGTTVGIDIDNAQNYSVTVFNQSGARLTAYINSGSHVNIQPGHNHVFSGPYSVPITVTLTD